MMAYTYQLYRFSELTTGLLYDILALRSKIFVVEQNIVYQDADHKDDKCLHFCMMDNGKLIGYARLVPPGLKFEDGAIGRIVLEPAYRGKGLGREFMRRAIDEINNAFPNAPHIVEAQAHMQPFYESLGYQPITEQYMLEGIMHLKMRFQKESPLQSQRAS
ncbi:MAG: GNAT family N-acetyltransferase [Rickettsiales bacterium]